MKLLKAAVFCLFALAIAVISIPSWAIWYAPGPYPVADAKGKAQLDTSYSNGPLFVGIGQTATFRAIGSPGDVGYPWSYDYDYKYDPVLAYDTIATRWKILPPGGTWTSICTTETVAPYLFSDPGVYTIQLDVDDSPGRANDRETYSPYPLKVVTDTVTVYTVDVNITTDIDNSGFIDGNDDPLEQVPPGKNVNCNADDDNNNGIQDRNEAGTIAAENDLIEVRLAYLPTSGLNGRSIVFDTTNANLKAWTTATRSAQFDLARVYTIGTDTIPSSFYVEGVAPGQTTLSVGIKKYSTDTNQLASDAIIFTVLPVSDAVAPTGSIAINNGEGSTSTTAVDLTLDTHDDITQPSQMMMSLSNDGSTWDSWEAFSSTKAWTLTNGEGTKTVYVRYKDQAGNISDTYSDTINVVPAPDTVAPTGSIVINNDEASTPSTAVDLTLSSQDDNTEPSQMMMSLSNDGTTWDSWEAFSSTKAWTLTDGEGTKTVYVRYRDQAGNISDTYSDSIILGSSRIIYVRDDLGVDANDGLSWTTAKKTVQAAIDAASGGDQVWVAQGTYLESVTLKSNVPIYGGFPTPGGSNPVDPAMADRDATEYETTIDGSQGSGSVVVAIGDPDSSKRIDGFHIVNGKGNFLGGSRCGGGIYCSNAQVTISNNRIDGNSKTVSEPVLGGGVHVADGADVCITSNVIAGNSSNLSSMTKSSGIYVTDATAVVTSNMVCGNSASSGGSVYCSGNSGSISIINNTIAGDANYCVMLALGSSPVISNNILATSQWGVYNAGAGTPTGTSNYVSSDIASDHQYYQAGSLINGRSGDPLFQDPTNSDYRLKWGSGCINAGDDTSAQNISTDFDGCARIAGTHVDIGADECQGKVATPTLSPGSDEYYYTQGVVLSCATPGAEIWYTLGTSQGTPGPGNPNSRKYNPAGVAVAPLSDSVTSSLLTVKALKPGFEDSNTATGLYTKKWSTGGDGSSIQIQPPSVGYVRVSDLFYDSTAGYQMTMRVSWGNSGDHYDTSSKFTVTRSVKGSPETPTVIFDTDSVNRNPNDSTGNYIDNGSNPNPGYCENAIYFDDHFGFQSGTTYVYTVTRKPGHCSSGQEWWAVSSAPRSIEVNIVKADVTENQAVDSRLDTRKVEDVLVNFQFEDMIYKGGLFAGYAAPRDESRVGRSLLKFNVPAIPSGSYLQAGSVCAYFNCLAYRESVHPCPSVDVGCTYTSDSSWHASTTSPTSQCVTWETSPKPQFRASEDDPDVMELVCNDFVNVTQNQVLQPGQSIGHWCSWRKQLGPIASKAYGTDNTASFILARKIEPILANGREPANGFSFYDGWAYFMKKEVKGPSGIVGAYAPHLLLCYGVCEPCAAEIVLTPNPVIGGNTVAGTVTLSRPAPAGGFRVDLSANSEYVYVSNVTVPAGQSSATFTVSTAILNSGWPREAKIRAFAWTSRAISSPFKMRAPSN